MQECPFVLYIRKLASLGFIKRLATPQSELAL